MTAARPITRTTRAGTTRTRARIAVGTAKTAFAARTTRLSGLAPLKTTFAAFSRLAFRIAQFGALTLAGAAFLASALVLFVLFAIIRPAAFPLETTFRAFVTAFAAFLAAALFLAEAARAHLEIATELCRTVRLLMFHARRLCSLLFALRARAGSHPHIGIATTARLYLFGLLFASATAFARAGNPFALTRGAAAFAFLWQLAFFHFTARAPLHGGIGKLIENRRIKIRTGFLNQLVAKLVAQCAPLDLANSALFQIAQLEWPKGNADKAADRKAQRTKNILHFTVLAFTQANGNPDIRALNALKLGFHAAIKNAIDRDAVFQFIKLLLRDLAMRAHAIAAQPTRGGQFQNARQPAIIGKEQKAFRVDIKTPDRQYAWHFRRQGLENRRAALRVAIGGHETGGLVIEPQAVALRLPQRLAVDGDDVGALYIDGGAFQHLAINRNAPGSNHRFRLAARGNARARQTLGYPLARLLFDRRAPGTEFTRLVAVAAFAARAAVPVRAARAI